MQLWRAWMACIVLVVGADSTIAQESQVLTYDAHGRLVSVHRDTSASAEVTTYGLDAADNRAARYSGPTMTAVWEAESLNHYTGYAQDEGWEANAQQPSNLLIAGPYTTTVPTGPRIAVWKMMVGPTNSSAALVKVDVFDLSTHEILAEQSLPRAAWRSDWSYQWIELPFQMDPSRAGHIMEFRIHYFSIAHVRVERCQVNRRRPKLTRPTKILGDGRLPSGGSLGAEASKRGPADEMTLGVEGVVDRCVSGEESLG